MPKYKVGDILFFENILDSCLMQVMSVNTQTYTMATLWEDTRWNAFMAFSPTHPQECNFSIEYLDSNCKVTVEFAEPKAPSLKAIKHKCHCPVFDVVHFGCKCGGV